MPYPRNQSSGHSFRSTEHCPIVKFDVYCPEMRSLKGEFYNIFRVKCLSDDERTKKSTVVFSLAYLFQLIHHHNNLLFLYRAYAYPSQAFRWI